MDPADAAFLASVVRNVRDEPKKYRDGSRFLQQNFSFKAIVDRRKQKLNRDLQDALKMKEEELPRTRKHVAGNIRAMRANLIRAGESRSMINAKARDRIEQMTSGDPPILRALQQEQEDFPRKIKDLSAKYQWPRVESIKWARDRTWFMTTTEAQAVCLVATMLFDTSDSPAKALPKTLAAIPQGHPDDVHDDMEALRGMWFFRLTAGFDPQLLPIVRLARARLDASSCATASGKRNEDGRQAKKGRSKYARLGEAMAYLKEHPRASNTEIGDHIGVDRSTVGRWDALQQLRQYLARGGAGPRAGFITRDADGDDRVVDGFVGDEDGQEENR